MTDPRILKLAGMLVNYSVAVKPGDKVIIDGPSIAAPLVKAVYAEVLKAGGLPRMNIYLPDAREIFYKLANDEQIQYVPESTKLEYETCDVQINIMADENTKGLSNINPERMALRQKSTAALMQKFMERSARGEVRWTLTLYPTNAHAQDAEMSLDEYADFVYNACMPDMDDPVGYWRGIHAKQQKIIDWLKGKQTVHILSKETDLRLGIAGRDFVNCACTENVPDGEIFTGPIEDSAEGHVYFSYPTIFGGREVTGVRLWFEKGKVVKATADKNEDFLIKTLDIDEGSRKIGEFAIGTNNGIQKFTGEILFDEKIGGSFHLALGSAYPETGSKNISGLHWDMICDLRDGGEIWVDDELLYKNGDFVLDL